MSPSSKPYGITQPHAFKRWIGSCVAIIATYTLMTLIILWMLNQHPIDVVVAPPAAPIVLEIAPLPTSIKHVQPTPQLNVEKQSAPMPSIHKEKPTPILSVKSSDNTADVKISEKNKEQTPIEKKTLETAQSKMEEQVQEQHKENQKEQPLPKTEASLEATRQSEKAAATNSGSAVNQSTSNTQWESFVLAKLQKLKRYPHFAQRMNQEDTIMVQITIDPTGRAISAKILKSKGYQALDTEVKALIQRASPFSPPPQEFIKNNKTELVVPIEFFIKNN